MSFQFSTEIDQSRLFLVNYVNLDGRYDPFCYIPQLVELDDLIKSKTKHRLKYFSIYHASGATPKKDNPDNYSDKEHGIPFIRVQNLSITGELDLKNLVYISKNTHEGLLRRSQIKEYDLLVKITGVGRMAVASVVPKGFEGNINQHIVLIRTGSKELSENIAAFLNLDSVEKIASKRSTGGTRPALDYNALFSIPIINNRNIYEKINLAVLSKKQKEAEMQSLLNGIDDYLLGELGIELPEPKNDTIQSRLFLHKFYEISGNRFDAGYHHKIKLIFSQTTDFPITSLNNLIMCSPQYGANECAIDGEQGITHRYIRITDIDEYGNLKNDSWKTAEKIEDKYMLNYNDLLFARSGSVGKAYLHKDISCRAIFAGYLIRFILNTKKVNPDFIFYYCHSKFYKMWVDAIHRPAVQSNINSEEYKSLPIILPPLEKQNEIANNITAIRKKAKQLQKEADEKFEETKKELEAMILGDN